MKEDSAQEGLVTRGGVGYRGAGQRVREWLGDAKVTLGMLWALVKELPDAYVALMEKKLETLASNMVSDVALMGGPAQMFKGYEVSEEVIVKGEELYASGAVGRQSATEFVVPSKNIEDFRDASLYKRTGAYLVYHVNLRPISCTCPFISHNPGSNRVCKHIYAAALYHLLEPKEQTR